MIRQRLRPLTPQLSGLVAACLLGAMGLIMLGSAWEDALTMDEPIHLIGVRHLLPVFPFTIILVSRTIGRWINSLPGTADGPIPGAEHGGGRRPPLAGDQRAARVPVLPRVLPRSGRRVSQGGGGRYVGDSNPDWGQDLRRLRAFADAHHTVPIAVDDFGGGSLTYELGESRPMVVG
jgi:hypothetical protein